MHIIIREGSAAKNYEALHELLKLHPDKVMFCSDDKHPDELVLHHINALVKRSLQKGYDLYDVLSAACVHPAYHYDLPVGGRRLVQELLWFKLGYRRSMLPRVHGLIADHAHHADLVVLRRRSAARRFLNGLRPGHD